MFKLSRGFTLTKATQPIFLLLLLLSKIALSQQNFTISGRVTDAQNGEGMIGVNVFIKELKIGASTNVYGFYSITAPKGKYSIAASYIGYSSITKEYTLENNQTLNFELVEEGKLLEEVVITGKRGR